MMHVTVVSESKGKSKKRVEAVLDSVLGRIGRKTWAGGVSSEGLQDLHKSLCSKASRTTAVACHLNTSKSQNKLVWVVGRKRLFSEDGRFPISTSRRKIPTEISGNPAVFMRPICLMAASLHDLGKLTEGMQGLFCDTALGLTTFSQPIRHELISLQIFRLMFDVYAETTKGGDELGFLAAISSPTLISEFLDKAWSRLPEFSEKLMGSQLEGLRQKFKKNVKKKSFVSISLDDVLPIKNFPLLHAVGFCVLSHHRIPMGRKQLGYSKYSSLGAHINIRRENMMDPAQFTRACGGWRNAIEGRWAHGLSEHAALLLRATGKCDRLPNARTFTQLAAHVCRTVLILGDHVASAASRPSGIFPSQKGEHKKADWIPHAKTQFEPQERGQPFLDMDGNIAYPGKALLSTGKKVLGDTWSMHTSRVVLRTEAALRTMFSLSDMPSISSEEFPSRSGGGRFAWQDIACDALEAVVPATGMALSFVVSGTGTGKTRGALRLTMAGRDEARVTTMLGLRSLTLQSGAEYSSKMGMPPSKISTIIGSQLETSLHAARSRVSVEGELPSQDGNDSEVAPDDDLISPSEVDIPWSGMLPPFLRHLTKGKSRASAFLSAPIVVCTADMIASAGDTRRSSHLNATVRVASSDLIIDEFESYSTEDTQALCRIVHLASLSGKRVTVCSATVSPVLMESVYLAYSTGAQAREAVLARRQPYAIAWVSEFETMVHVDDSGSKSSRATFRDRASSFLSAHTSMLSKRNPLRSLDVLDMEEAKENDWMAHIMRGAARLHADNHIVDPSTGRRISIGFIRLNVTKHARALALHLLENGIPGFSTGVLCYHARFPVCVRSAVDNALGKMLSRGHDAENMDPVLSNQYVRRFLDDGKTGDVLISIVTTPLLELGRDFDLDWGIIEPSSPSSVVQSAGRVSRHRPWKTASKPNLLMLSSPLDVGSLERQGMLSAMREFGGEVRLTPKTSDILDCFPIGEWRQNLDARDSLSPSSPGGQFMEAKRGLALLGDPGMHKESYVPLKLSNAQGLRELSLENWIEDEQFLLTTAQADFRQFRRKSSYDIVFYLSDGIWRMHQTWDEGGKNKTMEGTFDQKVLSLNLTSDVWSRSVFPSSVFEVETQMASTMRLLENFGETIRPSLEELTHITLGIREIAQVATLKVDWHPLIGMDRVL